jgi:rhodanese-related sulfurtransferase
MTTTTVTITPMTTPSRLGAHDLADQLAAGAVTVIDVREPMEFATGHIAGSLNVPLSRLAQADLPRGPLVLVCQSGNRSGKGLAQLLQQGHPHPVTDLLGGLPSWEQAGFPVRKLKGAPLPLMRQVQIVAGSLVLLGVILSQVVAPGWIWLRGFVGAGLTFAGVSGFCGMARLLAVMPWNRVSIGSARG